MSFQEKLRGYRIAAGYKSAKDFADLLGVPYTTYVAYENKDREPRYNTLCKIAQLLKVTPNDLLEFRLDPLDEYIAACRDAGFSVDTHGGDLLISRKGPGFSKDEEISLELNKKDFAAIMKSVLDSEDYKASKRFSLYLILKKEFQFIKNWHTIIDPKAPVDKILSYRSK